MMFVVWDVYMVGVLGWLMMINLMVVLLSLLVDVKGDLLVVSFLGELMLIVEWGENELFMLLMRVVWVYYFMVLMREILELEKEGLCLRDFVRVDKFYEEVVLIEKKMLFFFRLENLDMRFDDREDCYWLLLVRVILL